MTTISDNTPVPIVEQLLDLLELKISFEAGEDPCVGTERQRIADEYTHEAHAQGAAFILLIAAKLVVRLHGLWPVLVYLDEVVESFEMIARDEHDLACERRALLAWRDCLKDGEMDLAGRATLYCLGDLVDCAAGLHAALDNAVWMLAEFIDPDDLHHYPPYRACERLRLGVLAALEGC